MSDGEEVSYGRLLGGVTEDMLREAINRSGYPFQAAVANKLREYLDKSGGVRSTIQEEWAYVDAEANETRSIDIFIQASMSRGEHSDKGNHIPFLDMLVECKQSEMPYVFFLRGESPNNMFDFPEFAGAFSPIISFINDDTKKIPCEMTVQNFLAVWDFPFFNLPTLFAISVSRAARKGSKLELTGEDAYRSLTFPLLKASDHLKNVMRPNPGLPHPNCQIIVCLAVLRAPMYGVIRSVEGEDLISPVPWLRVCRLEPGQSDPKMNVGNVRYYDVVHEEYLADYMSQLVGDAKKLGTRVQELSDVIYSGMGIGNFVKHYESDELSDKIRSIDSHDDLAFLEREKINAYRIGRDQGRIRVGKKEVDTELS